MGKFKVKMICREIWRAEVIVDHPDNNHEQIKDKAWVNFDILKTGNLEQENFTKVERIE